MKLDLGEIATHLGKRIKYDIDEEPIVDDAGGLRCVERVTGSLAFSNTGRTIDVRGNCRTMVELECARCLRMYRLAIWFDVEEELPLEGHPWVPEEAGEEEEALLEEEREPLFVDNVFDLDEYLRQSILVNVPIKPLCEVTCKGLCPRCGANLNDGPCQCGPEPVESPFGVLSSLLEDEESES